MNKFSNIYKIVVLGIFISLLSYMIIIYINRHNIYEQKLLLKTNKIVELGNPVRGRILDRNGNVLVDNIAIKNIVFKYQKGIDIKNSAEKISKYIFDDNASDNDIIIYYNDYYDTDELLTDEERRLIDERKIQKEDVINEKILALKDTLSAEEKSLAKIYSTMSKGFPYESKIIVKEADNKLVDEIIREDIPGISVETGYKRYYPYGNVLKDVFGTVGKITFEEKDKYLDKGYNLDDEVGNSFLEAYYEDYLKGTKAKYLVNEDYSLTEISPMVKGNDLYLSIDINIQKELENIVESNIALAKLMPNTNYLNDTYLILTNPNTSEIIALIGKRYLKDGMFNDINVSTITSSYTVGSVVKGATISVGYKYGLINPDEYILDGCIKLAYQPAKCSFKSLGYINAITALKYSSNYYQFLIALHLTGNEYIPGMFLDVTEKEFDIYRKMLSSYGLGIKTGIDLPGEAQGQKGQKISGDLLLNLAIGQYDTYTPMQIMTYINTIAMAGNRKAPSLVSYIKNANDKIIWQNKYEVKEKVDIDNNDIELIKRGFKAVMESGGTGWGYMDPKFNGAGKTGTSESFLDSDNDGVIDTETITLTIGSYYPYDNPKYSFLILSPNISFAGASSDYIYYMPAKISREITAYLDTLA